VDVSDASGRSDPVEDFKVINKELGSFTVTIPEQPMDEQSGPLIEHPLVNKTMIVCATKIDSANPDKLKKLAAHVKRKKLEFHAISAVTGQGIEELKWSLARHLRPTEGKGK
jgi:GTP-binding protein